MLPDELSKLPLDAAEREELRVLMEDLIIASGLEQNNGLITKHIFSIVKDPNMPECKDALDQYCDLECSNNSFDQENLIKFQKYIMGAYRLCAFGNLIDFAIEKWNKSCKPPPPPSPFSIFNNLWLGTLNPKPQQTNILCAAYLLRAMNLNEELKVIAHPKSYPKELAKMQETLQETNEKIKVHIQGFVVISHVRRLPTN